MTFTPDIPTLRFCSLLQSVAYASIFLTLWRRRRDQDFLLHWGLSSFVYALALLVFGIPSGQSSVWRAGLEYGLVGVADVLLVTGMRVYDGKAPFRWWMALCVVATALVTALPLALNPGAPGMVASDVLGSISLAVCTIVCTIAILRNARDGGTPRRIVGFALLAYTPGYVVSVSTQIWGPSHLTAMVLLPMLQDQVLLAVLNLGLLAAPWERALRALKESVLRDSLTGAWNRAALKQHETELACPSTSLFLIDIDHFKMINDTHGHAMGDAVLIALSDRVQALASERGGMFVRLGGDEFVMVAATAHDQDARALAEQILAIPGADKTGLPAFSLSIGLARVHADEGTLSHAMARADLSLYRAKAAGRDQVAAA